MNMKKIALFAFILTAENVCAQSSYIYEVAEDAGYVNDGGFLNIIGLIIMLGLFVLFIPIIIGSKIDDYKFTKKYENRKETLSNEANTILRINFKYAVYANNSAWRTWFEKGYYYGVQDLHFFSTFSSKGKALNWEEDAELFILKNVRKELLGGDANISLQAYKAGYREGIERRKLRGKVEL